MQKTILLQSTDSTNEYASKLLEKGKNIDNFLTVCSRIQEKGKGIYGSSWHSEDYKNLTFSIIFFPNNLNVKDNFLLSMSVSLGICDYLKTHKINSKIKWPNDILIDKKKICGILIETNIKSEQIQSSVIGVGLNINQTNFPGEIKNPVSIKNITGRTYDIEEELKRISAFIIKRLKNLAEENFADIKNEYISNLYNYNILHTYKTKTGTIEASVVDVNNDGVVILLTNNGENLRFYFKEIVMI